jgi:hypothetical protein
MELPAFGFAVHFGDGRAAKVVNPIAAGLQD